MGYWSVKTVMDGLAERLAAVRTRIARAADRARRDPAQILLLAVTKIFPAEAIQEAHAVGLREFGENYVQEFEGNAPLVCGLAGARYHLIGHLQSNKAAKAAPNCRSDNQGLQPRLGACRRAWIRARESSS